MAFESRDQKYSSEILHNQHHHNSRSIEPIYNSYNIHRPNKKDENYNDNNCVNKEPKHSSSGTQTIEKVDAATMTDPLKIDFKLTSDYLARCINNNNQFSTSVIKYDEHSSSEASINNFNDDIKPKIDYFIESPKHINGMLMYQCPECTHSFENREILQEHLEDHKQRPYICDICGASLKRKEHLDRHKQGHNKDRPYQCSMCCKAFKRNEHLARHMIIHSGNKNQICTECGKAFYRKDHLKKHLQSHNGSRGNKTISGKHQQGINYPNDNVTGQSDGQGANSTEVFGNFATIMRQAGPPSFSTIRT